MPLVWVVDDDPSILEAIEFVLIDAGYTVRMIMSEHELLSLLHNEIPDVFLLDILLSGTDGRDIARTLREHENTKSIPIIMMSADSRALDSCMAIGISACIKKPFDIGELVQLINTVTRLV